MLNSENIKRSLPIYFFIATAIMLLAILRSTKDVQEADIKQNNKEIATHIEAVPVPSKIDFALESVPTDVFDVRERLDRELLVNTYWHSNSLQLFKMAGRWFPTIEEILAEECVPDDFKYMVLVESGLRNVVSGRDAVGVWQFLKGTGREYGLEINREVDERYHVEKSTMAACEYLKKAHDELGNWTLAAASYNIGMPRLKRMLKEQKVDSYYDLYLNEETARYVFRIIAVKEIFTHPQEYAFYLNSDDLYEPIKTYTVEIDSGIESLSDFALKHGTNYKTLKLLNPWLRQPYLKNRHGRTYHIKLPC